MFEASPAYIPKTSRCLSCHRRKHTQRFLPSGVSSKRFFAGVDFAAVRANFTLYYPGSQRVFFGGEAAIAVI